MPALAGRTIKNHVPDSEERKTGRCGQKHGGSNDEPLAVISLLDWHTSSSWLEMGQLEVK
jgi:hypothetical protein